MTATLVIRHEIFRALPKPLLISAVSATLVMNTLTFLGAKNGGDWQPGTPELFLLQAVILVCCGALFLLPAAARRGRSWELSLPVAATVLWRSHWLALIASGLTVLVSVGVVLVLFRLAMSGTLGRDLVPGIDLAGILARPALLLVTTACVLAARQPQLADLSDSTSWPRLRLLLAPVLLALLYLLMTLPLVWSFVPPLIGVVVALVAGRRLPTSLVVAPECGEAVLTAVATPSADLAAIRPSWRSVDYVILRQLFKWPLSLPVLLPSTAFFGVLMSGCGGLLDTDTDFRVFNFFMVVYILFAMTGHLLENLHRVDHLPIPRMRILTWLVLPSALALAVGYGGGRLIDVRADDRELIGFDTTIESYGLKVPPEFFHAAAGTEAPQITAPWGERHAAFTQPVFSGLPWSLWKPYTTPPEASPRFIAWQISRAVQAVYGVPVAPADIEREYLTTDAAGRTVLRGETLTLAADHPHWQPTGGGPVFPVLFGAEIVLWLLVEAFCFRLCGPGTTIRRVRVIFWSIMGGLMLLHIGFFVGLIFDFSEDWAMTGLLLSTVRRLGDLGVGGWMAAWLVPAVAVSLSWRLVVRTFAGVEAPRT